MSGVKTLNKPSSKATTRRVQLELPEKSMARLEGLKETTEAASYAEVMKNALRLYEAFIQEAEEGKEFLLKDKDGTVAPYHVFI